MTDIAWKDYFRPVKEQNWDYDNAVRAQKIASPLKKLGLFLEIMSGSVGFLCR